MPTARELLDEFLTGIADAIRYAEGSTGDVPAPEYNPRIKALAGGGSGGGTVVEPVLTSLEITENGTYTPEEGVDGFNQVIVNVPSGGGGAGLYDFLTSLGYTVLFADGEFHNTDVATIETYETEIAENGCLRTLTVDCAGFYTRGAGNYTIGVISRFCEADGFYTQSGTCTTTATLPTIQSKGTGRKSYSTLTGSALKLQTFNLSGSGVEKFLGTGGTCILDIMAIVIIP